MSARVVLKGNRKERGAQPQHYFESLLNRQYKYHEKDSLEKIQDNVRREYVSKKTTWRPTGQQKDLYAA